MNEVIAYIVSRLSDVYPEQECRDMAWWIAEETTGMSRTQLLCGCKDTKIIPNLEIILSRLRNKEPIQYIFGHTLWNGLDLFVDASTLIPRPETAELVDYLCRRTAHLANTPLRVLDIGTGTGCIAIALKKARPRWTVQGLDVSPHALSVARRNAVGNHVEVDFLQADILSDPIGDYDLIVSNPPYICNRERILMDENVLRYEPATALFVPDTDPLLFYRRIATLHKAPMLFFEINEAYGNETMEMLRQEGYTHTTLINDIYGKPRIVSGEYTE